jgi:hypothetical protein
LNHVGLKGCTARIRIMRHLESGIVSERPARKALVRLRVGAIKESHF